MNYDPMENYRNNEVNLNYSFHIESFKLISGRKDGYNNMYVRPFVSNITTRDIENMVDRYNNTGLLDHSNKHNMLGISSGINARAGIVGGWDAIRYIFELKIQCLSARSGTRTKLEIMGYTEPTNQIKIGDSFDVNLTYVVNSCKKVNYDIEGNIISITDLGVVDHNQVDNNINASLRPSDVINGIELRNIASSLSGTSTYANNGIDRTNVTFNRDYNSSNSYITAMFDKLAEGKNDPDLKSIMVSDKYTTKTNNILKGASKRLDQTSISMEPFFQILNSNFKSPGYNKFNLLMLREIIPTFSTRQILVAEVDDVSAIDKYNNVASYLNAGRMYMGDMASADIFTPIAYDIHNNTHSFMKSNFLGSIDFMVNNLPGPEDAPMMRPSAKYRVNNMNLNSTIKPEQQPYIGSCVNSGMKKLSGIIDTLINKGNSYSDSLRYELHVKASILETNIALVINGEQDKRIYRFPSFADMNYSPMLGNVMDMEKLIADFSLMTTAIQERLI